MPTISIRELAALCGVAVSTVSRAMNGRAEVSPATRDRVLAMAKKYHYVPNSSARSLKVHTNNVIAVLVQGEFSPLFLSMFGKFDAAIKEEGYSLMLTFIPDDQADPDDIARVVRDRKISGVIFLGRYGGHGRGTLSSRVLAEMGTPIVFCTTSDFSGSDGRLSSVATDDRAGSELITDYLIDRGHRRIVCVGSGRPGDAEQVWALRSDGFEAAMAPLGFEGHPLVLNSVLPEQLYDMENGYRTINKALDDGLEFTAIVAVCDAIAIGASKALAEHGLRVPDDVSIVGFDDLDVAKYLIPGLTTIAQPLERIVRESTRVLFETIAEPERAAERIRLAGSIVERDSVRSI